MESNYNLLIRKLDQFIRKYYKNLIIRGLIYSLTVILFFFLLIVLMEYMGRFNHITRLMLLLVFVGISLSIISKLILIPLIKLFRIGKTISHKKAAEIIGDHFENVKDKLLNTLQLKELGTVSTVNRELIEASIDQKIIELKPVPFTKAIDIKRNRKYLKYLYLPLSILLLLAVASPAIITEPARRIINYNQTYKKDIGYTIDIENQSLQVVQNKNFKLRVKIKGEVMPDNVDIQYEKSSFRMSRDSAYLFSYEFKNVQKNTDFRIVTAEYNSGLYTLDVIPEPVIASMQVTVDFPAYLNREREIVNNNGDLIIPEGSQVVWKFSCRETTLLKVFINDTVYDVVNPVNQVFTFKSRIMKSQNYSILSKNNFIFNEDTLTHVINVIPDKYPEIGFEIVSDTADYTHVYFIGEIGDDYGFSSLYFNSSTYGADGRMMESRKIEIPVEMNLSNQKVYFSIDRTDVNLDFGQKMEYFFEVFDNDGVNGPKSSKTQNMIYKVPSLEELENKIDEDTKNIQDQLKNLSSDLKDLKTDINKLKKDVVDKKNIDWQEKKKLEDIIEKKKDIQNELEKLQNEIRQNFESQNEITEQDERILEKQKQLNELMEEILDEDLKKMLDELQKMMDQLDQKKMNEMLEKMKMDNDDLEKELDRQLELMKQFEFEKKLTDAINKAEKLQKEQEKLSEENLKDQKSTEDIQNEQDKLNEKFEDLKKDLNELGNLNENLENKNELENTESLEREIGEEMKESSQKLSKNQKNAAQKNQKNASDKLSKLKESLQESYDNMMKETLGEDMNNIRGILENIIKLSFDQERLIAETKETALNNPKYLNIIRDQQKIKDDVKIIEDSLFALSKRQTMIQSAVNKEIADVNRNIQTAIEKLTERNKNESANRQQYAMTALNNLALLLSESLEQMMQQMMQMNASGSSSCNNPKPGASGGMMKSIKQMQEMLNKKLQEMQQGMSNPMMQGKGQQKMSEQLARMAAEQAEIRRKLEEYKNKLKEEGLGNDAQLNRAIQQMEQTETDLVNKRLSMEMLKRQQDIMSRLLESEKAERERDLDEKRESEVGRDLKKSIPPDLLMEYTRRKNQTLEILQTIPPNLNHFYKEKVDSYLNSF